MASLAENITQTIADFDDIKAAIIEKGISVPDGTPTKQYGNLIRRISGGTDINIKQYEYISTQNSGITVDALIRSNYAVECVYEAVSEAAAYGVWGNADSPSYPHWTMYAGTYYYGVASGENRSGVSIYLDTVCKVLFNNANNDITYSVKQADGSWNNQEVVCKMDLTSLDSLAVNYVVGDRPVSGGVAFVGKIYSFKIYDKNDNNRLIYDLVPVAVSTNNDTIMIHGMYDLVKKKFYMNLNWTVGGRVV